MRWWLQSAPGTSSSSSPLTYYLTDAEGSTRLITDSSGAAVASYSYDAFGNVTQSSGAGGNRVTYTGQWSDANGLQYLRVRYYDPTSGSFLSIDPAVYQLTDTREMNRYAYCEDNPLLATDITGMSSRTEVNGIESLFAGLYKGAENTYNTVEPWASPVISVLSPGFGTVLTGIDTISTAYKLLTQPASSSQGEVTRIQTAVTILAASTDDPYALIAAAAFYALTTGSNAYAGAVDEQHINGVNMKTCPLLAQAVETSYKTYQYLNPPSYIPYIYGGSSFSSFRK